MHQKHDLYSFVGFSAPGAVEEDGFDLPTLAEQRLQLLVVQEAVGRQVPHLGRRTTDQVQPYQRRGTCST